VKKKKLLAKSRKYGELTLKQHLFDTEQAAIAIFQGQFLQNWCRFFQIADDNRFLKNLQTAGLFHDLGKANPEFLAAVEGEKNKRQVLRHEWLSTLLLHLPSVRNWLSQSDLDLDVVTAAVLCHHLKADRKNWGKPRRNIPSGNSIELYLNYQDYPEIAEILQRIAQIANVDGLPELPKQWTAGDRFWEGIYQDANDAGDELSFTIDEDSEYRSLVMAVKAGLIVADSVASGIFRIGDSVEKWINRTLQKPAITTEEVETKILQPRYRQIEKRTNTQFELKPFQQKAQELSERVLLLSACGTGKTIFGYKWMQSMLNRYQVGHLIFLYPTRGTATEGFKDYVSWAPESDASLLTGTARYELQALAENPSESIKDKDFTTEERLFALGFWDKRFFSATVDRFLSFLTHNYSSICLLPVLANSVVVIDEVHSFPRDVFDLLIGFLQHFDIPVLCMTATLPKTRRQELEKAGLQSFPTPQQRTQLEKLREAEEHPRYNIQFEEYDYDAAERQAIQAYQRGERVLWVVNTVDRCRETATKLELSLSNANVLVYHSRFKLADRKNRHEDVIKAFSFHKGKQTAAIAVTTQVCEMSLDLDADLLITELAPSSCLIQRIGRANRHLQRGLEFRAPVVVYEPPKALPYKTKELEKARAFLKEVKGEASQLQLANALEHHSLRERDADGTSPFVYGGYWASSEPFRDTDDYSVDALLDEDLDDVKAEIEGGNPYDGYVVPVPKHLTLSKTSEYPTWMPHYMALASSSLYCSKKGFGKPVQINKENP
jgi:CRISPR-associated endonuclease/helicase Cas3